MLYKHSFWRVGAIGMSAISGIEQALWDIKGKALGVPVFELLGGRVRDRVRMYTHLGGGDMRAVYGDWLPNAGTASRLAQGDFDADVARETGR